MTRRRSHALRDGLHSAAKDCVPLWPGLGPRLQIALMTIELTENEKVRKLEKLGFIAIQHMAPAKEPSSVQEKNRKARAQQPKH